ncbi:hypothetical protein [uncultured Ruegeria sp.]|uniref:hypothetical protein n=1 Tax=uncultured Ruegeria sp. TaxID=259304 RepID=UPI00262FC86A|nr:hypothetical protein [uncultured Ruegeria sp.]
MRKLLIKSCSIVFGIFALTACSAVAVDPSTGQRFSASDVPEKKFLTAVQSDEKSLDKKEIVPVDDLTTAQFNEVLSELPKPPCETDNPNNSCVQNAKSSRVTSSYGSLSGITSWAFLRTAWSRGDLFGNRHAVVRGRILDRCLHDRSLTGYHYNKAKDTLRLCVLMVTKIARPADGVKIRFQYFHVEAGNVGVDKKRLPDGGPYAPPYSRDNVFYEAFKKTQLPVSADVADGFSHKLYAYGRNIQVKTYWEANVKSLFGKADFAEYKEGDVILNDRIRLYFDASDIACVDMLFPGAPPKELPKDAIAGVHYCLGRCAQPPIVNTK